MRPDVLMSSAKPLEFSIVIPALNEEDVIGDLLVRIDTSLEGQHYEVIVVDDGSEDATAACVQRGPAHWRVVQHERRAGQSAAIHTGVLAAQSTVIVTLDADGQNPPEEIPKLLITWQSASHDTQLGMVAGQRVKRQDTWSKRIASRAANAIRSTALKDGTRDTGCGLKVFRKDVFLALPYFNHMHRYLPALVARAGYTVAHQDVAHAPRQAGTSKYKNLQRALVGAIDLLGVMWLIKRRKLAVGHELQRAVQKESA